jgi:hypothetical protein
MSRSIRLPTFALGLVLAAVSIGVVDVTASALASSQSANAATSHRAAFHDEMRKLWEDHITWTRLFIVSAGTLPSNLPDIGPTTDRLLQNQTDIGDAFKPFYGAAAGGHLTALLRVHILTAAELIADAKAGNAAAAADASARWYANADEIAAFLHSLNPNNWPLADLKAMMKEHLDLTLKEAVARLQGRYADDVAAYDEVHAEILQMADVLSAGIIAQFPSAFAH